MERLDGWDNLEVIPGANRAKRVIGHIKRLVHFLPDTPLATHGDHLPTELSVAGSVQDELPFDGIILTGRKEQK